MAFSKLGSAVPSRGQSLTELPPRYLMVGVTRTYAELSPSSGKRLSCFFKSVNFTHANLRCSALVQKASVALESPKGGSPRV